MTKCRKDWDRKTRNGDFFKHILYECQKEVIQASTEVEAMGMGKRNAVLSVGAGDQMDVGLRESEKSRVPPRSLGVALDAEEPTLLVATTINCQERFGHCSNYPLWP